MNEGFARGYGKICEYTPCAMQVNRAALADSVQCGYGRLHKEQTMWRIALGIDMADSVNKKYGR